MLPHERASIEERTAAMPVSWPVLTLAMPHLRWPHAVLLDRSRSVPRRLPSFSALDASLHDAAALHDRRCTWTRLSPRALFLALVHVRAVLWVSAVTIRPEIVAERTLLHRARDQRVLARGAARRRCGATSLVDRRTFWECSPTNIYASVLHSCVYQQ